MRCCDDIYHCSVFLLAAIINLYGLLSRVRLRHWRFFSLFAPGEEIIMEMDLIQLAEQSIQLSDLKTFLCRFRNKSTSFLLRNKAKSFLHWLFFHTAGGFGWIWRWLHAYASFTVNMNSNELSRLQVGYWAVDLLLIKWILLKQDMLSVHWSWSFCDRLNPFQHQWDTIILLKSCHQKNGEKSFKFSAKLSKEFFRNDTKSSAQKEVNFVRKQLNNFESYFWSGRRCLCALITAFTISFGSKQQNSFLW